MTKAILKFLILIHFLVINTQASFLKLEIRINGLIEKIRTSKAVFIRADVEYDCVKAAEHIQRKFNIAKYSPMTPSRDDWTYEFFVDEIASKSSSTNESYFIVVNGLKMTMKEWIMKQDKSDQT